MKPDAVKRGIVGEILHRFERAGLKIVGMKLVSVTDELAEKHYLTNDTQVVGMGNKTLADCEKFGIDPLKAMGTNDPRKVGEMIWKWNLTFLKSGPVLAIVLEGAHAVENIRMMVGPTLPSIALPGTIRGDFALDSAISANARNRAIYNLVHASGTVDEAEREINLWFKPEELLSYRRVHEDLYSY
jgi:nucleoside-diphosphate kinase